MIKITITSDFTPYADSIDEGIMEGNLECNNIIRELGPRFSNVKFEVKHVPERIGDLKSTDEAKELRMMQGSQEYYDDFEDDLL